MIHLLNRNIGWGGLRAQKNSAKFQCQPSAELDFYIRSLYPVVFIRSDAAPVPIKVSKQADWEVLGLKLMVIIIWSQWRYSVNYWSFNRVNILSTDSTSQTIYFCDGELGWNMLHTQEYPTAWPTHFQMRTCWLEDFIRSLLAYSEKMSVLAGIPKPKGEIWRVSLDKYMKKKSKVSNDIYIYIKI